jgi:hypothetical protein
MATPTFKIDIEKRLGTEWWTNSYLVDDPTIADAIDSANDFVARERAIHYDSVTFTKFRVSDLNSLAYNITVLSGTGAIPTGTGVMMPLFNVVRVDFSSTLGRPCRKYLRGCLRITDVFDATTINGNVVTRVQDDYGTPMASDLNYVDPQGDEIVGAATFSTVGMRQLRRAPKRNTPVLP